MNFVVNLLQLVLEVRHAGLDPLHGLIEHPQRLFDIRNLNIKRKPQTYLLFFVALDVVALCCRLARSVRSLKHRQASVHIIVQLAQILLNLKRLLKHFLLSRLVLLLLSKDLLLCKMLVRSALIIPIKLGLNLIQIVQNADLLPMNIRQFLQVCFLHFCDL